jgi:hypothetical protein
MVIVQIFNRAFKTIFVFVGLTLLVDNYIKANRAISANDDCGLLYFFHIGKTGGSAVESWLRTQSKLRSDSCLYLNGWKLPWEKFTRAISSHIEDAANENAKQKWMFVHHHSTNPGMEILSPYMRSWRNATRSKGCTFASVVVLREPTEQAWSLIFYHNTLLENLHAKVDERMWPLNIFLGKEHGHVSNITDVSSSLTYLEDYDIVGFSDALPETMKNIQNIIKWEEIKDFNVPVVRKTRSSSKFLVSPADTMYLQKSVDMDEYFYRIARLKYRGDNDNLTLTASELIPFRID